MKFSGECWSIALTTDQRGIASGGPGGVKFWQFEFIPDESAEPGVALKRLTLVHVKTLQLEEDVLCVRFSPDHRLIAASLLDSTVKIFFVDTLKHFLTLYGHKFPVLCMDISSDSTTIITAGTFQLWQRLDCYTIFRNCYTKMMSNRLEKSGHSRTNETVAC